MSLRRIKQKQTSAKRQKQRRETREIQLSVSAGLDPEDGKPLLKPKKEASPKKS